MVDGRNRPADPLRSSWRFVFGRNADRVANGLNRVILQSSNKAGNLLFDGRIKDHSRVLLLYVSGSPPFAVVGCEKGTDKYQDSPGEQPPRHLLFQGNDGDEHSKNRQKVDG